MEELTRRRAEFDDLLEELRAAGQMGQVGMITASVQPLADLCKNDGLISPFFNIYLQETLGLLEPEEWRALVSSRMPVSEEELASIERLAFTGSPFKAFDAWLNKVIPSLQDFTLLLTLDEFEKAGQALVEDRLSELVLDELRQPSNTAIE
jgi:hypothetical protein